MISENILFLQQNRNSLPEDIVTAPSVLTLSKTDSINSGLHSNLNITDK